MLQMGPVVQINSAKRTRKSQSKKKNWRDFKGRELGKSKWRRKGRSNKRRKKGSERGNRRKGKGNMKQCMV
jgi:hypothetical protein